MKLYGYWRSSAAYRVRIALHLKALSFDNIPVHLVKNGGEQHSEEYTKINQARLVPTLVDNGLKLNQSIAIIDYLENKHPDNSIYPASIEDKALVQALALDVACEIHPLNNLRVQQYLVNELAATDEQKQAWFTHWVTLGFAALEQKLETCAGKYCFGDSVTLADICLVPQVYNAHRFKVDMNPFPLINAIVERCNQHPAFIKALPENQPDAV